MNIRCTLLQISNVFVFFLSGLLPLSLFFCYKYTSLQRLQRIQNCLARLVKYLPRSSPTSSVIKQLNWLRIDNHVFKILILAHKSIHGSSLGQLKYLSPTSSRDASFLFGPIVTSHCFVRFSILPVCVNLFLFLAPRLELSP